MKVSSPPLQMDMWPIPPFEGGEGDVSVPV
jgi:hypothetical protein